MNHTFYTNYIPAAVGSTWDDSGSLHLLATGEFLRRATKDEAQASEAEGSVHGCTGAILVDGLTCYVQP